MRHWLALAVLLAACSKEAPRPKATPETPGTPGTPGTPPANPPNPPAGDACAHLFDPPAGADLLCDEHVMGSGMEIHWRSYGLAKGRALVNMDYHQRAGGCQVGLTFKPPLFDITMGDQRLETYEPADTSYPSCEKKPAATHETVVVISQKYDHK